jgi:hypothetical protein
MRYPTRPELAVVFGCLAFGAACFLLGQSTAPAIAKKSGGGEYHPFKLNNTSELVLLVQAIESEDMDLARRQVWRLVDATNTRVEVLSTFHEVSQTPNSTTKLIPRIPNYSSAKSK